MKKRSRQKKKPLAVEDLDPQEREIFLKAFFTGELQKRAPEKKPEILVSQQESVESKTEYELFLQAVNEGLYACPYAEEKPEPKRVKSTKNRKHADSSLDLHGMAAEDAVRALLDFIKREKTKGSKTLLVVHGKGTGILRNAVWAVLETHPLVNDFQVAPARFGGGGALIVRINRKLRW